MPLPRYRVLIPLACALFLIVGCTAPGGQSQQTVSPQRTLVPTFTPTAAKPTATPLPPEPTAVPATPTPAEPSTATPLPATPTPLPKPQAVVTLNNLNIRSGPSTSYPSIARGAANQRLEITGRNADSSWWQICCVNSKNGWVSAQYVRVEGNAGAVEVVKDVAPPPTSAPQPTARPRPTAQPTTPPAAATIFVQTGLEIRDADDTNFGIVTFWGRLGKTGEATPYSGGYKLRVSAPSGTQEVPFGATWQNANPGQPSEFKYNAKLELPRTAGAFRAVVIDGGGKEVSDVISGNLKDRTHDVLVTWWKR
ncbi:MAG: SH3 domain-containing protein [Anaerolineae bacterium]